MKKTLLLYLTIFSLSSFADVKTLTGSYVDNGTSAPAEFSTQKGSYEIMFDNDPIGSKSSNLEVKLLEMCNDSNNDVCTINANTKKTKGYLGAITSIIDIKVSQ